MTEKLLPEQIDPFRYAEQNLKLSGAVRLADMSRIANNLNTIDGEVHADLQFSRDEQKLANIKGCLKATLTLQCQRCMEPFVYEIMTDFALGIVNTLDEANALPSHYEPVMTQEGQLALRDLIEDELILSLPIIPKHEPEVCPVKVSSVDFSSVEEKRDNPFQVLETLKQKQK